MKPQIQKSLLRWLIATILVIAVCIGAFAVYVGDHYRVDEAALSAHTEVCDGYQYVDFLDDGTVIVCPDDPQAGFIFYPGGKVEYTAYIPLMAALAERGIACLLPKMPCNLAVLDMNAADGMLEAIPDVTEWYIGGHSLGGSMAASYVASHTEEFEGLVLLGAYSTVDLSATSLRVLSLFGSEDGVMNPEKYEKYRENLPANFTEVILAGGNHAGFGMYGVQKGDGIATITGEEQIALAAEHIAAIILGNK